ncbi:MAG: 50S ribosomal protein L4 [Deltaproteobacteria bacterium]|nr:50S ribosomal protein L4 [Deltaproteobacteria bacterium]
MATFDVKDQSGKKVSTIELDDAVFAARVNENLFYEVIKWQHAKARQGTHSVKNRSKVSGGGAKPYRQKGTGRARQGSTRASQWVGGGRAMRPKPHGYGYALPKKVRKGALRSAVSLRAKEGMLFIIDNLELEAIKTKSAAQMLGGLGLRKALIVEGRENDNLQKSVRNLSSFQVLPPEGMNVRDILRHEALVLTTASAKAIEEALQ